MKIQDIAFFIIFVFIILSKRPHWATIMGLVFLFLSIPLFSFWVFFTAERLTWYAAACFLLAMIMYTFQYKKQ